MNHPTTIFTALLLAMVGGHPALAFDHDHTMWNRLTGKYVHWIDNDTASRVDYRGLQEQRDQLKAYLGALSAVSKKQFDSWPQDRQLAFLINAYNAFTVDLILTRYPGLESIKDLGSFIKSPWKKKFFDLLGKRRTLDELEHKMIRARGVYDEPRIHVALVCAAIGCPGIRSEAFTAAKLESQLEDSVRRFLSDRSRNRFNRARGRLEVSKIFNWYEDDFASGFNGIDSLATFFSKYATLLADSPADQQQIRNGKASIAFLKYDWKLNGFNHP